MSGIGWNGGQGYAPAPAAQQQSSGVPQMPYGQPAEGGGRTAVSFSLDDMPQQQGGFQQPQQPVYGQQSGNVYTPQNFQPQGYGMQQTQGQPQAPQQQGLPPQQFQQPAPGVYNPQQDQTPRYGPSSMGPQTQLPQPQAPGRIQLDDNTIIDGAGVPQELRGRSWGEARRLYSALATDWLQRNRQPQTPAAQTQQQMQQGGGLPPQQFGQPQQPQQPQGSQFFQQQRQPQGSFFTNPDERIAQVVREQIEQTVLPALQPMVAQSQSNGIVQARNIAATGMPDWQSVEPGVMEMLASADPRDLQNPQVWVAAARMVRGQLMEQGRYQAPRGGQVPQPQLGPGAAQPVYSYFSEAPTAPGAYTQGQPGGQRQPSQEEILHAQRFQMDIPTFMAWKYGQPSNGGNY